MLLPIKEYLMKTTMTSIIAPHGMTDLIHANKTNILPQLFTINAGSVLGGHALHVTSHTEILTAIFLICSVAHFRHDMPEIVKIPKYWFSAAMLPMFTTHIDLFYLYMLFIHVPNHYKMNWRYMQSNIKNNVMFMIFATIVFSIGGEIVFQSFMNDYMLDMSKSVIIAHILYEETFIHNKKISIE